MCKKIFNWLKKQFGQNSPSTPEEHKQDVQTNTPSSPEGQNVASTEVRSSADAVGASTEEILKKVEMIEEYLKLEKIASEAQTIDYSFVKDSVVRGKLISDHTSMWRCRLGIRTHNPEFNEFCLYVQMQVESLLRYYYSKRFNNDESKILKHLNEKNSTDIYQSTKDKVQYSDMLYAFGKEFKLKRYQGKITSGKYNIETDILDTIRILRNGLVHSGYNETVNLSSKFIDEVLKYAKETTSGVYYFIDQQVSINSKATIDLNSIIDKDPNKFAEYRNIATAKDSVSTFNKSVKLKILKEQKPFDAIIIDLKKWVTAIQSELSNVK